MAVKRTALIPKLAKHVADTIPGAQLYLVPNAGHVLHFETPDVFNRELLKFLKANPLDMTDEPLIRDISDTARWMAVYRARETRTGGRSVRRSVPHARWRASEASESPTR